MLLINSWLDYEHATIGVPLSAATIYLVAESACAYVHVTVWYFHVKVVG